MIGGPTDVVVDPIWCAPARRRRASVRPAPAARRAARRRRWRTVQRTDPGRCSRNRLPEPQRGAPRSEIRREDRILALQPPAESRPRETLAALADELTTKPPRRRATGRPRPLRRGRPNRGLESQQEYRTDPGRQSHLLPPSLPLRPMKASPKWRINLKRPSQAEREDRQKRRARGARRAMPRASTVPEFQPSADAPTPAAPSPAPRPLRRHASRAPPIQSRRAPTPSSHPPPAALRQSRTGNGEPARPSQHQELIKSLMQTA